MIKFLNRIFIVLAFVGLFSCLVSCQQQARKRPFGIVKLGKIVDLMRPESFLSEHSLLLRYDERGFSAMSLLCSHDLAVLKVKQQGEKQILVSPYSDSSYNLDGTILSGPTKFPLPYFELEAASGEYGGPVDTLYAKIGTEKSPSWRLAIAPAPAQ